MSEYKDFVHMIDIIGYALEIQGRAEESFRRSAKNSTREVARNLFAEIADDFGQQREKFQVRKQKLLEALSHLRSVEQNNAGKNHFVGGLSEIHTRQPELENQKDSATTRDPVCDMQVSEDECPYVSVHRNEKYFFCCEDCQKAFELYPRRYIAAAQ